MGDQVPICFVCEESVVKNARHVGAEARKTLIKAATVRGDTEKQKWFENDSKPIPVHINCYRKYSHHERAAKQIEKQQALLRDTEVEKEKHRERQLKKDNVIAALEVFNNKCTSTAFVETAGQTIFTALYNGSTEDDLARTRFRKFSQCATKTKVNLCSLPPSPDAANFHSRRVYLQVQAWLGNYFEPTTWGWKKTQRGLEPVTTVKPPAPSEVMDLISCSCQTNGTGFCGSRCGCRKAGVHCSVACKNCCGEDCSNAPVIEVEEDTFLDDDDLDFPSQVVHLVSRSCWEKMSNNKAQKSDRRSAASSSSESARSESPEQEPLRKKLRSSNKK